MTRGTALGAALLLAACSSGDGRVAVHVVTRGDVVKKALATGAVEPERETQVNTQLTGFVRTLHARLGQRVEAGAPLAEVWPALTEQDLLRAERSLQSALEGEEAAQEFVQGEHALAYVTRLLQGEKSLDRMQRAAERGRRSAEETLRLLREGKVEIDGRMIDFVVRAPVAGHVLQLVREGDPVTPASSYGLGTVIAVIGDLDKPVFRGAVDEIDVGRLTTGMPARVRLGPLPEVVLDGTIVEIGLRARRTDNATTFDVRIALRPDPAVPLRAGYSAVAELELARASGVVVVPERLLRWADGRATVTVVAGDGAEVGRSVERAVELGVADGLLAEVRAGLSEGERVVEPGDGR
ncbi:MAG: HlyD family efflux transporter periplasmic adaptor subunit [Planctomycetes bacterium]|nr:HlyD family efflux transporter periplasmic adaptor subunit [Planctomycetota bacterium]